MANPGGFNPGAGEDWIGRELAELRRELRELRAANVFGRTGITPKDGGTEFDGFVNVNGPMSITGTLNLPAGIIGNDALAAPIYPTTAHANLNGFSLTTGDNVEKLRATITVPDGYTRALVMASATMTRTNPTAADDSIYLDCRIDGVISGWSSQSAVAPGRPGFVVNIGTALLTGLSGTFHVGAYASTALATWPEGSGSAAVMDIEAIVLFLR